MNPFIFMIPSKSTRNITTNTCYLVPIESYHCYLSTRFNNQILHKASMCTMCRVSTVDINKVMKSCEAIYIFQPEKYITMDAEMTDMTWRHYTGDN